MINISTLKPALPKFQAQSNAPSSTVKPKSALTADTVQFGINTLGSKRRRLGKLLRPAGGVKRVKIVKSAYLEPYLEVTIKPDSIPFAEELLRHKWRKDNNSTVAAMLTPHFEDVRVKFVPHVKKKK